MLFKNGQNLTTLAETADSDDTRRKVDWIEGKSRFVAPYFSDTSLDTDFLKGGTPTDFCKKGCRPRFNSIYSVTGGQSVTLSIAGDTVQITDTSGQTQYTLSSDKQIVIVEIIGAGGGGSGGSATLNGVGGGAGAFALIALRIDKWRQIAPTQSITISVGTGGTGSSNRGQASAGTNSSIAFNGGALTCGAGGGGDGGDTGNGGSVSNSLSQDVFNVIYSAAASNGYAGLSGEHTFSAITLRCGYDDESQCAKTYGAYSVSSNEAGAGGNSFFGAGGNPGSSYGDGGGNPSETAYGAGGGGGRAKAAGTTVGGTGANGIANLYY